MLLGEYKRELSTQKLNHVPCESCGAEQLEVKVFSTFFVLGFPAFPTGKPIEIQCRQCKKLNHINFKTQKSAADRVQRIVDQSKHKWYTYLLPIILGITFVYMLINKPEEFKQEMGFETNSDTPVYVAEPTEAEASSEDIKVEGTEIVAVNETAEKRYEQLTYKTSDAPEHAAAQYLLTLFSSEIKANNNKGFEVEAESDGDRILVVCYVPNLRKSTTKAKEELLQRTEEALRKKFGYTQFYLAFYGYDTTLYALKAGEYTAIAQDQLTAADAARLPAFYE